MRKLNLSLSTVRSSFSVFVVIFLLLGLLIAYILAQRAQDNRQRATSSTGTGTLSINSGTTFLSPSSPAALPIVVGNLGSKSIDGIQIIANITGTVPAGITYVPSTVSGLSNAVGTLEDVAGGKRLSIVFIGPMGVPYQTNNQPINLGELRFTSPASGTMTIAPDSSLSKVLENQTGTDLLGPVSPTTLTFGLAPTPTVAPTPTASPSTLLMIPGGIEAENYATMSGVQTESTRDTGGGLAVINVNNGDWMEYQASVAAAGSYTATFRVASAQTGTRILIKNSAGTTLSSTVVPNTGDLLTWTTVVSTPFSLPAGSQRLRIESSATITGITWSLNWFDVNASTATSTPTPTPVPATPTPTPLPPTPTPTATPRPLGTITFRLAGVQGDVGPINVRVQMGEIGATGTMYSSVQTATHSGNGNYTIAPSGSLPQPAAGKRYWMALKGPKHVQRVFADINYWNISTFTSPTQVLQPGDVPPQNGVVDANDVNTILAFYTKATHTSADLAIGDLNFDGVINAIDMGLLLSTLSTKSDEIAL